MFSGRAVLSVALSTEVYKWVSIILINARCNHTANHAMDLYSTLQGIDTASCYILLKPLSKCQPEGLNADFTMTIPFNNLFSKYKLPECNAITSVSFPGTSLYKNLLFEILLTKNIGKNNQGRIKVS